MSHGLKTMNRCADGLFGDASHHAAYCAHSVYLVTHQPIEDLFGSAEMHSEVRCKKYVKWRHYCFERGSVDERVPCHMALSKIGPPYPRSGGGTEDQVTCDNRRRIM